MKKKYFIIPALLFSLSYNNYSFAKEIENKKEEVKKSNFLTLFDAIEIAVQNNYSLKLAYEKINLSKYQITENAAQGLPQVSINTSYSRQDPVTAPPPSGGGIGNNPQFAAFLGTARVNTFRNQVTLSQVLFAGFRIIDGIRLANINVSASEEEYRKTRQDVIFNVSNSYYNALKSYQLLDILKFSLKQAEMHLDQAKKFEKAGTGLKIDVLRANNQLINIQMQLSQAVNNYEKAKKALNLAMGRAVDTPIEMNPKAEIPDISLDEEKFIKTALENRSELKQLKIKKEIDEILVTIQSRATWPTISANLTYNLTDQAVVNGNSVNIQNLNYGVNMNWPIFDGLLTQAKVQKAQNSVIQDQISIDQLQQSLILEVKQNLLDLQESKERMLMAKEGIKLSEEALRLAKTRYENGVGLNIEVIDAQNNLNQSKLNFINAEYDFNINKVKLYKAIGIDI
jgi:outer membrane protein TolC